MKKTKPENMNRLLTLIVLSVMLLLSCSKERNVTSVPEVVEQERIGIEFESYLQRTADTKGSSTNPLGDGVSFNMKAYYNHDDTTERFYTCVKYDWNSTTGLFTSSPVYYWPVNGTLDFYAVAPSQTEDAGTTIQPDKKITMTALDGKTDMMTASLKGRKRTDSSHTLNFGHKLVKVVFKAVGADPTLKYEVTSIKLEAYPDSEYSFPDGEDAGNWTTADGTQREYTYVITGGTIDHNTSSAQNLGADGYGLMLIPEQPAADSSVVLTVSYKAYHKVGDGSEVCVHDGTHQVDLTSNATSGDKKWGTGKCMSYTLKLKPGDPITFSAEVSQWTDEELPAGVVE